MERIIDELAKCGSEGILQNVLTKLVGIPANKLAYTLTQLEVTGMLHRESTWVDSNMLSRNRATMPSAVLAGQPPAGGGYERGPDGQFHNGGGGGGGGGGFNRQTVPLIKTNRVTLAALRRDPGVGQPLTAFAGHAEERAGNLVEGMVRARARARPRQARAPCTCTCAPPLTRPPAQRTRARGRCACSRARRTRCSPCTSCASPSASRGARAASSGARSRSEASRRASSRR